MPMMMDDQMDLDVDDLFGDGAGLSMPSRPPSKELHQRIDDLRGSGCCQCVFMLFSNGLAILNSSRSIAWSKWGSIASISANGLTLELRNLRCNPSDGDWGLSEPTLTQAAAMNMEGPLKHLAWSPTGSELAVIDNLGRVTILGIFASLNKPSSPIIRSCQTDAADDLHRIVGCYWLNQAPYPANRPVCM